MTLKLCEHGSPPRHDQGGCNADITSLLATESPNGAQPSQGSAGVGSVSEFVEQPQELGPTRLPTCILGHILQ